MIAKWKVSNFKSICQETELDFAPLTIFAGANSSGKSTLLQSILLVAQTSAHKIESRPVVLNGSFALLGQFDDLRSLDSSSGQILIGWTVQPPHDFRTSSPSFNPYRARRRYTLSSVSCEIVFDTGDSGKQNEISHVQPRLVSSQLSTLARDPKGHRRSFSIAIRQATGTSHGGKQEWIDAFEPDSDEARANFQYDVELDRASRAWLNNIYGRLVSAELKLVGCLLKHFLPKRLFCGTDRVTEDVQTILETVTGNPRYHYPSLHRYREIEETATETTVPPTVVDFILDLARVISEDAYKELSEQLQSSPTRGVSLRQLTRALYPNAPRTRSGNQRRARFRIEMRELLEESEELEQLVYESVREERKKEPRVSSSPLPPIIEPATEYLETFFSRKVRYLGPLRDEPKPLYPLLSTADPYDVGLKGEHTASVLELHKEKRIRYLPTSAFKYSPSNGKFSLRPRECPLETAVVDWLRYLDVAEGVKSEDKGKLGHELTVQIAGTERPRDLTHVGVGVSQVLPILVTSLLSESDTTLIFEQPELHLHPKVQTRLADFFLSITQLGKQCVLETHSEYLINRIRLRVAEATEPNPWVKATKMYFVERPSEGSIFQEVKINEYGAVMDWPEGFFDQSQEEAEKILLAAVRKRKVKRGG